MKNGTNNIKTPVSQEDIYAYERGWAEEMVKIWKEKIMHYRIRHTGALFNSVQATSFGGSSRTIAHKFLLYGLYQEAGTGNGYYHGNPGDLEFLDPEYRAKHHLGEPRQRRPWFNRKYYASIMKLNDMEGYFYGEEYKGLMADLFKQMFGTPL